MGQDEVRVGDIGTYFRGTIKDGDTTINVSSATTKQIIFKDPSGNSTAKDASFFTDGSDGIIQYQIASGDLDEAGTWYWQGYVVLPGSGSWKTDLQKCIVYPNL